MGDACFGEDDNHRVSVAHYQEVEVIKAEGTEFFPLYWDILEADGGARNKRDPLGTRGARGGGRGVGDGVLPALLGHTRGGRRSQQQTSPPVHPRSAWKGRSRNFGRGQ